MLLFNAHVLNVFVNSSCSALKKENWHTRTRTVSCTLSKTHLSDARPGERNFCAFDAPWGATRLPNRPEQRETAAGGTEENPAGVCRCCRRICDRVDPLSLALKPDVIWFALVTWFHSWRIYATPARLLKEHAHAERSEHTCSLHLNAQDKNKKTQTPFKHNIFTSRPTTENSTWVYLFLR